MIILNHNLSILILLLKLTIYYKLYNVLVLRYFQIVLVYISFLIIDKIIIYIPNEYLKIIIY